MQKFSRIYDYIHEYQKLVYDVYSKSSAVAYLVTYYNLNASKTTWDNENLMGGAYEKVGDLSGIKRNKILLLPVYFPETISTAFDGQETGYHKDNESTIVIPSSYGITPYPGDALKLEQSYLRATNDTYPMFMVEGVEISANTDKRYWKLNIKVFESKGKELFDSQTSHTYVFFDYDKKIHTLDDSQFLTKMLVKNETLRSNLKNLFDENSGFYLI